MENEEKKIKANAECQKCGGKTSTNFLHSCPYAQEIHEDDTAYCNCCEKCTHECAMDI